MQESMARSGCCNDLFFSPDCNSLTEKLSGSAALRTAPIGDAYLSGTDGANSASSSALFDRFCRASQDVSATPDHRAIEAAIKRRDTLYRARWALMMRTVLEAITGR